MPSGRAAAPPANACRFRPAALLLALSLVAVALGPRPLFGDPSPAWRGRPLVDALEDLRARGLNLIFSSAVVTEDLVVTIEPRSTQPRAILDEILAPLGLLARDGPAGSILIVRPPPWTGVGTPTTQPRYPRFIDEIVVTPGKLSIVRQEQGSPLTIRNRDAVLVPSLGVDVSRILGLLPGVAVPDNSAAFGVRGSQARDVSLVLDGLELLEPSHLQSFQSPFSLIDSEIVDSIDFYGGGLTADFGDRHGGFVKMSTWPPSLPTAQGSRSAA